MFRGEEYSNDKIICPYCKTEYDPCDWEGAVYDEEGLEEECPECSKKYHISPSCSWSWSTFMDCEINGEKHDWKDKDDQNKHIGEVSKTTGAVYHICSKCFKTEFLTKEEIKKYEETTN